MAEKVYAVHNLDCANCAAKIEEKLRAHPQVKKVSLVFSTRQLRLEAEAPDSLLPQLQALGRTVEPDFTIASHVSSSPAHRHNHQHTHSHHHHRELPMLVLALALFLAGIFLKSSPLSLALFIPSYLILGFPIWKAAGKHLMQGDMLEENFLMSIATVGAFAIGEYPEAVGIMLFYRIGEWFEHRAVSHSRKRIMEAVDLRPETVTLASGEVLPAQAAQVGDLLQIRPGDRIPLDCQVISGSSRLDTAPITGESLPVAVKEGSALLSGCMNLDGVLIVRVEKPLSESFVSRILQSVEQAAAGKPKIQRFITRFARVYTPIVIALAICTAVIPGILTGNWSYWVYTALSFLVMSCPCALVLSVPLSFFCGIGTASKAGILFKDGAAIEAMAGIQTVVLDKTGTLTQGEFAVQQADDEVLALCAACEACSTHPIAKSVVAAATKRGLTLPQISQIREIPGQGITAQLKGETVLCGNEALLEHFGISTHALPKESGGSLIYIARGGAVLGSIFLSDAIKPDAASAVSQLKKKHRVVMLTGDRQESAAVVANTLGICHLFSGLLPQEKLAHLQSLRKEYGSCLFVGDGINDAPVLAGADVGGAMGSGADAALEAADVVYLTSEVNAICQSLSLAAATRAIAWQNVIFALGVKLLVMVLGLLGHASMWGAVFADSGVAMLCVVNALRLLYRKNVK